MKIGRLCWVGKRFSMNESCKMNLEARTSHCHKMNKNPTENFLIIIHGEDDLGDQVTTSNMFDNLLVKIQSFARG
jgi:hypothetical protein